MKKVVLISVGQPSTNPRLVKEANALQNAGYEVYVIYTFWTQWAWETDKQLFKETNWTPILAGGSPFEARSTYFFTRLRVKAARFIAKHITLKFGIAEIALGRTYPELLKKAIAIKADLYIAHIQAALPVAVKAAKKRHVKCGFDIEDFHRHEVTDDTNSYEYVLSKYIDDKYLPLTDYLTASSPLIADEYRKLYPNTNPVTILNVFPKSSTVNHLHQNKNGLIKLFWFSQTIGNGRGLCNIIRALKLLENNPFELHLLGQADDAFKESFDTGGFPVYFHQPVNPNKLIEFAMQFDIGIAAENNTPYNRDICLTNKIFTYMQAGLAVIASDTTAQQALLTQYPAIGLVYQNNHIHSLAAALRHYSETNNALADAKQASFKLAQEKFNWEQESIPFLQTVQKTLQIS
ncbi:MULTISPECIES: glycosyltransferase [unclassified Mucilaginibacter]|uniref:glycosyltransferase n=1 Tax=unclassified Mucilaginibacter TaxID=2617802 RepID=UPI002AC99AE1|nr:MULTISPECIES: glycosyltransferase [unclassified Mucilaginibacter]MEB0260632.1 glycosyltransferase [Mucilaginibacter sp. 10I4]MEB0277483.1 glycosyltransferase [Mucilaginibacter sp. 10B2]MEB0302318.1 glycosyltransferase [Mucilaginibacter sp. 5C4]WPX24887.1 glycosyltransferase [Mucilaginibacter sp. 5C4]